MKKSTNEEVLALISSGFATKVAKKNATEKLNRVWRQLAQDITAAGLASSWDLPDYAHQVSAKTETLSQRNVQLHARVIAFRATYALLKAAPVVKVTKVDDSKMRDLSPAAATTAGIDFIDLNGQRRGYCYCCGRIGFVLDEAGTLSRHGYSRPGYGYDIGGCSGTRRTPEATLDIAIAWEGRLIGKLEVLLATDLFAFAIEQGRNNLKADRRDWRGNLRPRHSSSRDASARALRSLRNGEEHYSMTSPSNWRTVLGRQLKSHQVNLANLEEVQAGI